MMHSGFISVWVITLGLATVAGMILLLIRHWRREHRRVEPVCGRCGYVVRGLPTFTCPECGNDLREVGILAPNVRAKTGVGYLLAAWTLGLGITAVLSIAAVWTLLPIQYSGTQRFDLRGPRSRAYNLIRVDVTCSGQTVPPPPRSIFLGIERADGSSVGRLWVDAETLVFSSLHSSYQPASSGEINLGVLLGWLKANGIDEQSMDVQAEAADVHSFLRWIKKGQAPETFSTTSFLRFQPMGGTNWSRKSYPWFPKTALLFWLGVWVVVAWGLRRKHGPASLKP